MRGGVRGLAVVVAIGLAQTLLAAECVDGVTPDCSDAAALCDPVIEGGASDTSAALPETSTPDAAADGDPDGGSRDADADAGDARSDADGDARDS